MVVETTCEQSGKATVAFDPIQEDCLRLILESMRREGVFPLEDQAYVERVADIYCADPARLIRSDRDRSFHLVARATELIDYRIPFMTDEAEIDKLADEAEGYLREAAELDRSNWDAKRMLAALDAPTNDAYVGYLLDNREAVERDLADLDASASDPYAREFAGDLGRRPYLRWLAAIASRALIAGQYRLSLDVAEQSLAVAPQDPADVRHTAMLALAKLEVEPEELERFRERHAAAYPQAVPQQRRHRRTTETASDAWTLIAQMCLAYRSLDYDGAERTLRTILQTCPHAAQALFYQAEFPDGVFCRVNVEPGSDDELVLALSEATPLLQEGVGTPDDAAFSLWVSEHELVQAQLDGKLPRVQAAVGFRPGTGGAN